ncbi:MAG: TGS domain-containing protein, partial [Thermoplasmata archaeon]
QARIADLLLLMVDVHHPDVDPLLTELQEGSIRIDQEPPQVSLRRADRGGLHVAFTGPQTELDADTVREVTREWGMVNGQITIREDLTVDRLVDHLAGNRVYVPGLVALNKIDLIGEGELDRILRMLEGRTVVPISAKAEVGIDLLIETIYARLSFIRVYLKPPGQKDAAEEPIILRDGGTVADVCRLLHRDFVRRFRRAEVWGPSARYPGQRVGVEHALRDGDVLSLSARPG